MNYKKKRLMRGCATICAFLCALFIGAEMVAGSGDYKDIVNSALGATSVASGTADTYAFQSEFESTTEMLTERAQIAEQIGEEGCVLLKNDNDSLPLRKNADDDAELKVTMLGSRAYTYFSDGVTLRDSKLLFYGGETGSKVIAQSITTEDGTYALPITLEKALKSENITINPALINYYSTQPLPTLLAGGAGSGNEGAAYSVDEAPVSLSDCGEVNSYNDACFVVIGRYSGEGRDYFPGQVGIKGGDGQKSSIGLSDDERALIELANQISQNVVVLINSAVAMEIEELKNDARVDSVLWIGLPGAHALNGVARVISGKASPSGKLSDTYAVNASNSPAAQNFGVYTQDGTGKFTWSNSSRTAGHDSHYVVLAEGMYTGYYYYETRYADAVENKGNALSTVGAIDGATEWKYQDEVSYTFGYGKSYTTFTQAIDDESWSFDSVNKTISVDVLVDNTGNYPAKSVVQLYVQTPYTSYDISKGIEKPAIQLVTFEKTDVIYPDDAPVRITLTADIKYFASYDKTISHDSVTGGYIIENGDYYFAIGNGSHEALNNVLSAKGITSDRLYLEDGVLPNPDGVIKWVPSSDEGFSFNSDGVDSSYFCRTENGTLVQNQLADGDYNYFKENTIKYLTRNDWAGTFPTAYAGLEETPAMQDFLNSTVYKFGSGGSSNVEFGVDHEEELDDNGNPMPNKSIAEYKLKSYDDEEWDYILQQITFDEAWKFSPYGGTNCIAFASVNSPVVWQIDGPNGNVNRPYSTLAPTSGYLGVASSDPNANYVSCDMPCAPMTASTFNRDLVERQGEIYGEDNLWSRNPIMWAPGMNLHRTPFNSRNHEYYSEDPMLTNVMGTAFVQGGLCKGAILSSKHFAFNTQESYREGLVQFMEEQSARELELRAFQGLSEDAVYINGDGNEIRALGLMTSFSRLGVCGVNAHTGLMKNILRGEWGFKGLISTDMVTGSYFFNPQDSIINNVTFMATSSAVSLLNGWPDYNNKNKVKNDPKMLDALYENMHYYMYAIANSSALNGIAPGDKIEVGGLAYWEYILISASAVFGVSALTLGAYPLIREIIATKKGKGVEKDA